jgi:hypothetical protein
MDINSHQCAKIANQLAKIASYFGKIHQLNIKTYRSRIHFTLSIGSKVAQHDAPCKHFITILTPALLDEIPQNSHDGVEERA